MAWPGRAVCRGSEPEGEADSEIALRPHLPKWHFASAAATAADSIFISSGRMKERESAGVRGPESGVGVGRGGGRERRGSARKRQHNYPQP